MNEGRGSNFPPSPKRTSFCSSYALDYLLFETTGVPVAGTVGVPRTIGVLLMTLALRIGVLPANAPLITGVVLITLALITGVVDEPLATVP